jgi:hypothetical protein
MPQLADYDRRFGFTPTPEHVMHLILVNASPRDSFHVLEWTSPAVTAGWRIAERFLRVPEWTAPLPAEAFSLEGEGSPK